METIKCITEAFSMQPTTRFAYPTAKPEEPLKCKVINEVTVLVDEEKITYYIGYNAAGQKLFAYRKNSVNVHYQI